MRQNNGSYRKHRLLTQTVFEFLIPKSKKMFRSVLKVAILIFGVNALGQTKIASTYEFTYYTKINTHILEEYNGHLYFDDSNAVFSWEMIGDNSLKSNADGNFTRAEHLKHGEFNLYKKKEKQLISKSIISKSEHHYVAQEAPDLDWDILDDSMMIAGYQCNKAITDYMGRTYTAWFTKEIPVSYGPWKLHGLPGLILKATDVKNEISFSITEINEKKIIKEIDYDDNDLVSLGYYYQRMVDYPFEQLKISQSKASRGATISITNIEYNFLEKDFEKLGKTEFKN